MTFSRRDLWLWPALACVAALTVLQGWDVDYVLADSIYSLGGQAWSLRRTFLTETVIHDGGRHLSMLIALSILGWLITQRGVLHPLRRDLMLVLAGALLSVAVVNVLKYLTDVPCPWHLTRYGGIEPHSAISFTLQGSYQCFPAGHASAAYCWFGAFFFARIHAPRWRMATLAVIVLLGIVFGAAQQIRGAHFLSHDIASAWICWTMNLAVFYRRTSEAQRAS